MGGWIPTPADDWAETAELLSLTGRPWPRGASITDLRWFADRERAGIGRLPGYRSLVRRWNWSEWAVRALMRAEDEWQDPIHRSPLALPPQSPRTSTAPDIVRTPETVPDSLDSTAVPSHFHRSDLDRRGDPPSPSPSPSPGRIDPPARAPATETVDSAAGFRLTRPVAPRVPPAFQATDAAIEAIALATTLADRYRWPAVEVHDERRISEQINAGTITTVDIEALAAWVNARRPVGWWAMEHRRWSRILGKNLEEEYLPNARRHAERAARFEPPTPALHLVDLLDEPPDPKPDDGPSEADVARSAEAVELAGRCEAAAAGLEVPAGGRRRILRLSLQRDLERVADELRRVPGAALAQAVSRAAKLLAMATGPPGELEPT